MFYLAVLFLLAIYFFFWVKNSSPKFWENDQKKVDDLNVKLSEIKKEDNAVCSKNIALKDTLEERLQLYNISKDISKDLDEKKVFNTFKERIKNYINLKDCKFLKGCEVSGGYEDYLKFEVNINDHSAGCLVAKVASDKDKELFGILAQQFSIAMKRIYLYKRIQSLAIMDGLTNVFSRRHFLERFEDEIKRSRKFNLFFSFLMIDIDKFKDFNDAYGHLVGDAILREVSKVIKDTIRQIDFAGRYGGEEFCVVLPEADKEQAVMAAERLRLAIESKRIKVYDEELKVTVSIGAATFPSDAQGSGLIIEAADKALYLSKETGRNKVSAYRRE